MDRWVQKIPKKSQKKSPIQLLNVCRMNDFVQVKQFNLINQIAGQIIE